MSCISENVIFLVQVNIPYKILIFPTYILNIWEIKDKIRKRHKNSRNKRFVLFLNTKHDRKCEALTFRSLIVERYCWIKLSIWSLWFRQASIFSYKTGSHTIVLFGKTLHIFCCGTISEIEQKINFSFISLIF